MDINEPCGVFCKDDPSYLDQSLIESPHHATAIYLMALYFLFLLVKYPIWLS